MKNPQENCQHNWHPIRQKHTGEFMYARCQSCLASKLKDGTIMYHADWNEHKRKPPRWAKPPITGTKSVGE